MSRLSGYTALAAAALVFAGSTTAVAVAAAQHEPSAPEVYVPQGSPPAPATTGYQQDGSAHHQNRRGRGHGSSGHGGHDDNPDS